MPLDLNCVLSDHQVLKHAQWHPVIKRPRFVCDQAQLRPKEGTNENYEQAVVNTTGSPPPSLSALFPPLFIRRPLKLVN